MVAPRKLTARGVRLPLHEEVARAFDFDARWKGQGLADGGRVRTLTLAGERVLATVACGGLVYRVEARYWPRRGKLEIYCGCASASIDARACEHVWALLLTADARSLLPRVSRTATVRVARLASPYVSSVNRQSSNVGVEVAADFASGVGDFAPLAAAASPHAPPRIFRMIACGPSGLSLTSTPGNETAGAQQPPPLYAMLAAAPLIESDFASGWNAPIANICINVVAEAADGRMLPVKPGGYLKIGAELDALSTELLLLAIRGPQLSMIGLGASTIGPLGRVAWAGSISLRAVEAAPLLERLLGAGRLLAATPSGAPQQLQWDGESLAKLHIRVEPSGSRYALDASLELPEGTMPPSQWSYVHRAGLVIAGTHAVLLSSKATELALVFYDAKQTPHELAPDELEEFLDRYYSLDDKAPITLTLPHQLVFSDESVEPTPVVDIGASDGSSVGLPVHVGVRYAEREVELGGQHRWVHDLVRRARYPRDLPLESEFSSTLDEVGVRSRPSYANGRPSLELRVAKTRVREVVLALLERSWAVSIEQKKYQRLGAFHLSAKSGIDWLELDGTVRLDDREIPLGELIRALRKRGRQGNFVELGGSTTGVIPTEWLHRMEQLSALDGKKRGGSTVDGISLARVHAGAALALLDSADSSKEDSAFANLRAGLQRGPLPSMSQTPSEFHGTLRDYQKRGLGWLRWIGEMGFGGCLADDMGLGKTIQVLALLLARGFKPKPSLVIAPRSVVHNWEAEARRFAPALCPVVHLGPRRATDVRQLERCRLVISTYGTLMRDREMLQKLELDYLILDEAQAVKNPQGKTTAAARTMNAELRLALTGTPIENHLGELWSLLDVVNPGFGQRGLRAGGKLRATDGQLVKNLIKPFILRRTKRQVARDLPERVEQTIIVNLSPTEKRRYRELHDHLRREYTDAVSLYGAERSTPRLLVGLLRLRQAACHQGLLDKSRAHCRSSKLDVLLERLGELREEGAKSLVFSQFTSHLDIVQAHLDDAGIKHVRLDGRTQRRAERVKSFQEDPDISVFLISLKAGGTGLNLTAAEYVFLLDPWWNPAAEAQAIDRAHRIGQTSTVIAYRLIAADTIEEKVTQLQASKRALVESVFGDESAFLGKLTREELLHLLD